MNWESLPSFEKFRSREKKEEKNIFKQKKTVKKEMVDLISAESLFIIDQMKGLMPIELSFYQLTIDVKNEYERKARELECLMQLSQ